MELEIFGFCNSTRLAMFKFLSKPNFDKIARSSAVLLLLRSRDMEGCQNFKSRSRDPLPTPFDLILHFFRWYPW